MTGSVADYSKIVEFIKEIELLKDTTRTAWTTKGKQESTAEHSWRLALFSLVLGEYSPHLDLNRVIRLCLVHDLGELYGGDVSAILEVNPQDKLQEEEEAMQRVTSLLPENSRNALLQLWQEYNRGETEEAKFVKALDKMETIIQHNQGDSPADFNYEFNITYGKEQAMHNPVLTSVRALIDKETERKANGNPL